MIHNELHCEPMVQGILKGRNIDHTFEWSIMRGMATTQFRIFKGRFGVIISMNPTGRPPRNVQTRRFAITMNNYTDTMCRLLETRAVEIFKYFIAAKEVGEQLTPHLQCYGEVVNKCTAQSCKAKLCLLSEDFRTIHIEVAGGNAATNIEYCSKTGTPWLEVGSRPKGQGKRTDLDVLVDRIVSGDSIDTIIRSHGSSYIKFNHGIQQLYAFHQAPRNFMTVGYWLYGDTGTGKSRWAHENFPGAYWKLPDCKWFDGYQGEETIIFDDFRPTKEISLQFILRMVDRYPMKVEIKGSHVNFAPKRVIFTTPQDIDQTFQHLDWIGPENLNQLHRRFAHRILFAPGTIAPHLAMLETASPVSITSPPGSPAPASEVSTDVDDEDEL